MECKGIPVAEVLSSGKRPDPKEREARWQAMLAILDKGIDMGGIVPTKDEMHER